MKIVSYIDFNETSLEILFFNCQISTLDNEKISNFLFQNNYSLESLHHVRDMSNNNSTAIKNGSVHGK